MSRIHRDPETIWRLLFLIVLILGVSFRFTNLDQKMYWEDETYTSLRSAGYTVKQGTDHLYTGQVIGLQDLQAYQRPAAETSAVDVIRVLAEDDTHPPLYFLLARTWAEWFGTSSTAMRALPACFSLLAFPLIYWLCLELFQTALVGWFAVSLVAVSPIFVRYAQESRQYSLWMALILLSEILLLRAMRSNTKLSWAFYTLSGTLGLYTHLFSSLWLAGQGLYVFMAERFRRSKAVFSYGITVLLLLLAFTPWLVLLLPNLNHFISLSDWITQPLPILVLASAWNLNFSRLFISWAPEANDLWNYLSIPLVLLAASAVVFLCQQTAKKNWLFILTPVVLTAITLVLLDLILGGRRSRNPQYFFPCYISIQLAVAYLLASKFNHSSPFQRRFWQLVTVLLIAAGVLSCAINSQAETWWQWSEYEVKTCQIVNQVPQPLLISDARLTQILPLSYQLEPKVRLMLLAKPTIVSQLPGGFSDVFLYNPSEQLLSNLKQVQTIQTKLIYQFRENSLVISLYHLDMTHPTFK